MFSFNSEYMVIESFDLVQMIMTILHFSTPTFQTAVFCEKLWQTSTKNCTSEIYSKFIYRNKTNVYTNLAVSGSFLEAIDLCEKLWLIYPWQGLFSRKITPPK